MASHIYHGGWVNWEHGAIQGATITMSTRSGALLTSFIAAFVTLVATQLWRILCFAFHQLRSSRGHEDGLHHQQQVVFRNAVTPGSAAWTFILQTWFWRSKARMGILRTLPWAIFSVAYVVLFALAAVFSADISKAPGSARLLIGERCGYWAAESSVDGLKAFSAKMSNDSVSAATYARSCYGGAFDPLQCGRYPVSELRYDTYQNATCPFASGECYYGDTAAFNLTTRPIDSFHDLGINSPKNQRMQFQFSTNCAPLLYRKHWKVNTLTANSTGDVANRGLVGDTVMQYLYGPVIDTDTGLNVSDATSNYNNHSWIDDIGYGLESQAAYAGPYGSSWLPIKELNRTDADISIMFIAPNAIKFMESNTDPVFSATDLLGANSMGFGNAGYYTSDNYVVPIGCVEQQRICNPNNGRCSPYMGWSQLSQWYSKNILTLGINNEQFQIALRLASVGRLVSIYQQVNSRGGSALRATETVSGLFQFPISNTQWQTEVSSWFDSCLSRLQQEVQEFATGPAQMSPHATMKFYGANSDLAQLEQAMCKQQMINDTRDTISFSVLGLAILFVFGGIIAVTSFFIEAFVSWVQKSWNVGLEKRTAWMVDDKLQLQRLLFQETGNGNWNKNVDAIVPVTESHNEKFAGIHKDGRVGTGLSTTGRNGGYEYNAVPVPQQYNPYGQTYGQGGDGYTGAGHEAGDGRDSVSPQHDREMYSMKAANVNVYDTRS